MGFCSQQKAMLSRKLPDVLKLAIANKIENNLFTKVLLLCENTSLFPHISLLNCKLVLDHDVIEDLALETMQSF